MPGAPRAASPGALPRRKAIVGIKTARRSGMFKLTLVPPAVPAPATGHASARSVISCQRLRYPLLSDLP